MTTHYLDDYPAKRDTIGTLPVYSFPSFKIKVQGSLETFYVCYTTDQNPYRPDDVPGAWMSPEATVIAAHHLRDDRTTLSVAIGDTLVVDGAHYVVTTKRWPHHYPWLDRTHRLPTAAAALQIGPTDQVPAYAWPGGYPIVYVVDDGEVLCAACVNEPTNPVHEGDNADGWRVEGWAIHYEGPDETCAHCSCAIPSAYGDPADNLESETL